MTTYVLHGGETKVDCSNNRDFFKSMLECAQGNKILLVYFAREESDWKDLFENDKENFTSVCDTELSFSIAENNSTTFIQQIKEHDLIYVRGGRTQDVLLSSIKKISDIQNIWKGKVIGGSSAGANMLSTYYYDPSEDTTKKGLGILPIYVCVHSNHVEKDVQKKLAQYDSSFVYISLPETEYVIREEK